VPSHPLHQVVSSVFGACPLPTPLQIRLRCISDPTVSFGLDRRILVLLGLAWVAQVLSYGIRCFCFRSSRDRAISKIISILQVRRLAVITFKLLVTAEHVYPYIHILRSLEKFINWAIVE